MQANSNLQENNRPDEVMGKIDEIAQKAASGGYIYRGEPKRFCKVSSSLYRQYQEIESEHFDIEIVQREILAEAKKYTQGTADEILAELQHYGGKTNLIDFTADYLIAIFFACDGFHDEDGRVILLQESGAPIIKPKEPMARVIAQKSIFVQPSEGFVRPDHEVIIPKELKQPLLDYLRNAHGISTETIYNDLHGFIKHQHMHQSAYAEFYKGLTHDENGNDEQAIKHYTKSIELNPQALPSYNNRGNAYQRSGDFNLAIKDYNKAIDLDPSRPEAYINRGVVYSKEGKFDLAMQDFNKAIDLDSSRPEAYVNRGVVYQRSGDIDLAIKDYNKAIALDPSNSDAYYNRGEAWLALGEWENARNDLLTAMNMEDDIVSSFHINYQSVADFEQKHSVGKVPPDITEMLGG